MPRSSLPPLPRSSVQSLQGSSLSQKLLNEIRTSKTIKTLVETQELSNTDNYVSSLFTDFREAFPVGGGGLRIKKKIIAARNFSEQHEKNQNLILSLQALDVSSDQNSYTGGKSLSADQGRLMLLAKQSLQTILFDNPEQFYEYIQLSRHHLDQLAEK